MRSSTELFLICPRCTNLIFYIFHYMGKTLWDDFHRYLRNFHGIYFAHTFMNPEILETVSVFETPDELIPTRATLDIGGKSPLGINQILRKYLLNRVCVAGVPRVFVIQKCHIQSVTSHLIIIKKNNWEDNSQATMLLPFPCLFW